MKVSFWLSGKVSNIAIALSRMFSGVSTLLHSHIGAAVGKKPTLLCGFGVVC